MFTGIITDIGKISEISDSTVWIETLHSFESINMGASISCSGICLTVIGKRQGAKGGTIFGVNVSQETLEKSNAKLWVKDQLINIEPSLKLGGELGGHLVTGHIDGLSKVVEIEESGNSFIVTVEMPDELARFIAPKGSICLDGASLTVNLVKDNHFTVCIIPHTWQETTLGLIQAGTLLNTEIDVIARYVARTLEFRK